MSTSGVSANSVHAEITEALLQRKRVKGKRLRQLCGQVERVACPEPASN